MQEMKQEKCTSYLVPASLAFVFLLMGPESVIAVLALMIATNSKIIANAWWGLGEVPRIEGDETQISIPVALRVLSPLNASVLVWEPRIMTLSHLHPRQRNSPPKRSMS